MRFPARAGQAAVIYRRALNPPANQFITAAETCMERATDLGFRVPRLRCRGEFAGHRYHVVEFIEGRAVNDNAAMISELIALHRKSHQFTDEAPEINSRVAWWVSQLSTPKSGLPEPHAQVVSQVAEAACALPKHTGTVLMHGDCVRSNLLSDSSGTIWWLDWELGLLQGWPAVDLITWILEDRLTTHGGSRAKALAAAFMNSSSNNSSEWQQLSQFAEAVGLSDRWLPSLVAVTMLKLVAEDRHHRRLHQGPCCWGPTLTDIEALHAFVERYPLP